MSLICPAFHLIPPGICNYYLDVWEKGLKSVHDHGRRTTLLVTSSALCFLSVQRRDEVDITISPRLLFIHLDILFFKLILLISKLKILDVSLFDTHCVIQDSIGLIFSWLKVLSSRDCLVPLFYKKKLKYIQTIFCIECSVWRFRCIFCFKLFDICMETSRLLSTFNAKFTHFSQVLLVTKGKETEGKKRKGGEEKEMTL